MNPSGVRQKAVSLSALNLVENIISSGMNYILLIFGVSYFSAYELGVFSILTVSFLFSMSLARISLSHMFLNVTRKPNMVLDIRFLGFICLVGVSGNLLATLLVMPTSNILLLLVPFASITAIFVEYLRIKLIANNKLGQAILLALNQVIPTFLLFIYLVASDQATLFTIYTSWLFGLSSSVVLALSIIKKSFHIKFKEAKELNSLITSGLGNALYFFVSFLASLMYATEKMIPLRGTHQALSIWFIPLSFYASLLLNQTLARKNSSEEFEKKEGNHLWIILLFCSTISLINIRRGEFQDQLFLGLFFVVLTNLFAFLSTMSNYKLLSLGSQHKYLKIKVYWSINFMFATIISIAAQNILIICLSYLAVELIYFAGSAKELHWAKREKK